MDEAGVSHSAKHRKAAPKEVKDSSGGLVIERPPGVPFQKIQFGMHPGGRSVLLDSRTCEDLVL